MNRDRGFKLRLLGPVELVADGASMELGGPRQRVVLAVLSLNANRLTSIDQLVDAVWGEAPPATARTQVQVCISALRKILASSGARAAIDTRLSGYVLRIDPAELDVEEFAARLRDARSHLDAGRTSPAAGALRSALGLWNGRALSGVPSPFLERAALPLEDRRRAAEAELVRLDLAAGRHEALCGELREMLGLHPHDEKLYGHLMLALYRSGRQAEALEVFAQARSVLVDELGVDPGQALRDLYSAVLRQDPTLDISDAADHSGGRPLERPIPPRQLPTSVSDFTGRDREQAEIIRRLTAGIDAAQSGSAVPIMVVSGPGGIGKSSLAIRAAHSLATRFSDGQLYAELKHRPDGSSPSDVLGQFLRALGVGGPALPDSEAERSAMYRTLVAGRRILVLLDDVVSAAQAHVLLPGAAPCAVIVTSRARLPDLAGAHRVDLAGLADVDSRRLLAKIVGDKRVAAEPEAGDELTRRCGGVPLAIRILGARLASRPHVSMKSVVARLSDDAHVLDELTDPAGGIRTQLDETYRQLAPIAQRLLARLPLLPVAEFPGWVCAALLDSTLRQADAAREMLTDARLLSVRSYPDSRGTRFAIHPLVTAFAREHLEVDPPSIGRAARSRALGGWLALAEEAHRREHGGNDAILHGTAARWSPPDGELSDLIHPTQPIRWLSAERAALVGAVRQAAAHDLDELAWDLAFTAMTLFEVRGDFDDWGLTAGLARQAALRAGNRRGVAAMDYMKGARGLFRMELTEAETDLHAALTGFDEVGDRHGRALALRNLAFIDGIQGRADSRVRRYNEALEILRDVNDRMAVAHVLRNQARFCIDEQAFATASRLLDEARSLCQESGARRGAAQVIYRYSQLHLAMGDARQARTDLAEVLAITRELDDRIGQAHALLSLAATYLYEGDLRAAQRSYEDSLVLATQLGEQFIEAQAKLGLGKVAIAADEPAAGLDHLRDAVDRFRQIGAYSDQARAIQAVTEAEAQLR